MKNFARKCARRASSKNHYLRKTATFCVFFNVRCTPMCFQWEKALRRECARVHARTCSTKKKALASDPFFCAHVSRNPRDTFALSKKVLGRACFFVFSSGLGLGGMGWATPTTPTLVGNQRKPKALSVAKPFGPSLQVDGTQRTNHAFERYPSMKKFFSMKKFL